MKSLHRVKIKQWSRVKKELVSREYGGRLFEIDGKYIKLFPLRVLAAAIDRTQRTITDWEREGIFPKPMYAVPGSNTKRWYSERQILALNEIWMKYRGQGKSAHFDKVAFLRDVAASFYKADLVD